MTKLAEVVSDQLGIPVDYTVSVDLTGFEALVEAIGGVNFDVPINMDYDDPIQNLSIHFKKGVQYLNGADAMRWSASATTTMAPATAARTWAGCRPSRSF